jgi:spore germination protein KC
MKTKFSLMLAVLINLSVFTGCYDSIEVDEQTYVIAIGIDKGKIAPLKVTIQYANAGALTPGGSGGSNAGGVLNVTIEAVTMAGALNELNGFIGKTLDVSHALLVVYSEDYARSGLAASMYGINRNRDLRPTMYMAISRGSAENYLKSIIPVQEIDPTKYYEMLFSAFSNTGYSIDTDVFKFYNDMESPAIQPTSNLVGVNKYNSSSEFTDEASTYKEKGHVIPFEGDFKAGDLPRVGDLKGELMGLTVFDGDKLVGELDGEAAMNYLMVTGKFNRGILTIPDPKVPDKYVILNVRQSRKPTNKVDINSSSPKLHTKIQLEGDITIIQSGYNYEELEKLPILESAIEAFVKKDVEYLVNKTIVDYKSDIFGFGKEVKKKFLTIKEWEAYEWLSKYKDSTFSVDVDMKIRRPGLQLRTLPVTNSEGKENSK